MSSQGRYPFKSGVLVTGNIADYPKAIRHGVEVMDPATYVRHLEALGVRW